MSAANYTAPFPTGQAPSAFAVADWMELQTLGQAADFKIGDLKSVLSQENVDRQDLIREQAWSVLKQRAAMLAEAWPFRVSDTRLSRSRPAGVQLDLYRYLCCIGTGLLEDADRRLFELIVANLLPALPGATEFVHVGAPASAGMDPSFRERVKFYAERAKLHADEVLAPPLPDDKDLGLDAVAWRPFKDPRGGELHFLAQCATGADWTDKYYDLDIKTWRDHLTWRVEPVRVFAIPFCVTMPPAKWRRVCVRAGLVLDRCRLAELEQRFRLSPAMRGQVRRRVSQLADA